MHSPKRHPAFTLLEIAVATAMLVVLLAASVRVLTVMTAQQRSAEHRALALQAVHNLVEQAENLPWEKLTADTAGQLELPPSVQSFLSGAEITATVVQEPSPVVTKRVTIELTWQTAAGQPAGPIRLTTWIFPDPPTENNGSATQ